MILTAFFKALSQIGDARFRRVLMMGIGLTFALLVAFYAVTLGFLNWITPDDATLPLIGEVKWLDDLVSWSSLLLMVILSIFLIISSISVSESFS